MSEFQMAIKKRIGEIDEDIIGLQLDFDCENTMNRVLGIKMFENTMNQVKTNKLVFIALQVEKPNKAIFPLLLAKYDDLMTASYDILSDMVRKGSLNEGYYLDYCKDSLKRREDIRKLCVVGSGIGC